MVPYLELLHYKTYINNDEAMDDLCEVMQRIYLILGKESIRYCREYLTLIDSDDIRDVDYEKLKSIYIHIYKTMFKDYAAGYETLEGVEYVLPSEYTLSTTCNNQLKWLYSNYKHFPITYKVAKDSIAIPLAIEYLRGKIEDIILPVRPPKMEYSAKPDILGLFRR